MTQSLRTLQRLQNWTLKKLAPGQIARSEGMKWTLYTTYVPIVWIIGFRFVILVSLVVQPIHSLHGGVTIGSRD